MYLRCDIGRGAGIGIEMLFSTFTSTCTYGTFNIWVERNLIGASVNGKRRDSKSRPGGSSPSAPDKLIS